MHSELLPAYPWSGSEGHPTAADNGQDTVTAAGGVLASPTARTPPSRARANPAIGAETGPGFRGPRTGRVCGSDEKAPPSACDDGPIGRGAGGQLRYRVKLDEPVTLWFAVAATRADLAKALKDPDETLARQVPGPHEAAQPQPRDLPGDRSLQNAVDYGKQNLADLTQTAEDLAIRFVDRGKAYPRPIGSLDRVTFIGAGYPDYPWLFATDGEYTAYAAVALGQFEPIKDHLIALQQVSDRLNAKSGKVAHEIVTDGSVYFGSNTDAGNTDESVKFPSAVALVWRWSGDNRFLDRLYDFSRRAMRYVVDNLDADKDGWPEGLGNVEREGMGGEKLDNTVYLIRGLNDLADAGRVQARPGDRALGVAARREAARRVRQARGGTPRRASTPTRWATNNAQSVQQHWIGVTPMETGLAPRAHANAALDVRETRLLQRLRRRSTAASSTRAAPAARRARARRSSSASTPRSRPSPTASTAAASQRRYTDANAVGVLDEQPGALPEILPLARPEPQHRPLLDVPLDVHAGLGPLRHRLAGDRAAARRAAGARCAAHSTWCRTSRRARRGSRATRSGSATTGPSRCAPCVTTTSTPRGSRSAARTCGCCASASRSRAGRSPRACGSTASA